LSAELGWSLIPTVHFGPKVRTAKLYSQVRLEHRQVPPGTRLLEIDWSGDANGTYVSSPMDLSRSSARMKSVALEASWAARKISFLSRGLTRGTGGAHAIAWISTLRRDYRAPNCLATSFPQTARRRVNSRERADSAWRESDRSDRSFPGNQSITVHLRQLGGAPQPVSPGAASLAVLEYANLSSDHVSTTVDGDVGRILCRSGKVRSPLCSDSWALGSWSKRRPRNCRTATPQVNCIDLNRTTRAALPRSNPNAEDPPPVSLGEANWFRKRNGGSATRHLSSPLRGLTFRPLFETYH
jgi:hypothetical protein